MADDKSVQDAKYLIEIVNNPADHMPDAVQSITNFLNAMIEMGKKLRGEPTDGVFISESYDQNGVLIEHDGPPEIIYHGTDGGDFDAAYFFIPAMLASTFPGTSGVRKKPARGRLVTDSVFESIAHLDPRRFRRCAVSECNKIFYAVRLDAECCSSKHATLWRTAKYRKREQRKQNYQYLKVKKGLKG